MGAWEVVPAARVIVVEVGHDDLADVARRVYSHRGEPGAGLLLGSDADLDCR
jgi:hypothetical protein